MCTAAEVAAATRRLLRGASPNTSSQPQADLEQREMTPRRSSAIALLSTAAKLGHVQHGAWDGQDRETLLGERNQLPLKQTTETKPRNPAIDGLRGLQPNY